MLEVAGFFQQKCWKFGGSDGTRTRGLWRDRPVTNGGFLRHFQPFHLHLPTFTYNDLHKNVGKRWLDSLAIQPKNKLQNEQCQACDFILIRREFWRAQKLIIISLQITRVLDWQYVGSLFNGKINERLFAYGNAILEKKSRSRLQDPRIIKRSVFKLKPR